MEESRPAKVYRTPENEACRLPDGVEVGRMCQMGRVALCAGYRSGLAADAISRWRRALGAARGGRLPTVADEVRHHGCGNSGDGLRTIVEAGSKPVADVFRGAHNKGVGGVRESEGFRKRSIVMRRVRNVPRSFISALCQLL